MKPSRSFWHLPLILYAYACAGTETGNPPTRNACASVVCSPCAPPIVLHVTDGASGGPIPGVAVDADTSVCSVQATETLCQLDGPPYTTPGRHALELSAPGHQTMNVEAEVLAPSQAICCQCGYTAVRVDVTLAPLSDSD